MQQDRRAKTQIASIYSIYQYQMHVYIKKLVINKKMQAKIISHTLSALKQKPEEWKCLSSSWFSSLCWAHQRWPRLKPKGSHFINTCPHLSIWKRARLTSCVQAKRKKKTPSLHPGSQMLIYRCGLPPGLEEWLSGGSSLVQTIQTCFREPRQSALYCTLA